MLLGLLCSGRVLIEAIRPEEDLVYTLIASTVPRRITSVASYCLRFTSVVNH
jgi:hypothetical protein